MAYSVMVWLVNPGEQAHEAEEVAISTVKREQAPGAATGVNMPPTFTRDGLRRLRKPGCSRASARGHLDHAATERSLTRDVVTGACEQGISDPPKQGSLRGLRRGPTSQGRVAAAATLKGAHNGAECCTRLLNKPPEKDIPDLGDVEMP
jgi:hypothetical protein